MAAYATSAAAVSPAARLFEEYGEQLYRFCLGRMRSREEAEDAVQSTFLRAHKALERGVVPEYEAAWLWKIAHNVCLTRRAVLARSGQTIPLHDRDDIEVTVAAPETRRDELWGLSDALAALTPSVRQAILLREWQGLSYSEIADAMGTTVSAVETLIFRGRRDLAAALSAEQPRRRRTKLLDLLAALLGPKLAAGAALLVLGGAGVGTAFELERQGTRAPVAPEPAIASTPIGMAISVPAAVQRGTHTARRQAPVVARPLPARPHAATPAAQAPSPAVPPAPAPAAAPQPAAPAVSTTVAAATTTAAAVPAVEAPTLSLPAVDLPAVPGPTVQGPTVEAPAVSVPQLPVDLGH